MMKIEEIKNLARQLGISTRRLKKAEMIKAIQSTEGNCACYGTGSSAQCGQHCCAWREDCV